MMTDAGRNSWDRATRINDDLLDHIDDLPQMTTVFISYIRENRAVVERLAGQLQDYSLDVRTDFSIPAGTNWKRYLREEIKRGDFFVACFSKEYSNRKISYMNEELTIAIEQLRLRPHGAVWLIPVRLDPCTIPERDIGAGETLASLQWVDLFDDWEAGVEKIATAAGAKKMPVEKLGTAVDATKSSSKKWLYPKNLILYAIRLHRLGLTPERLTQCVAAVNRYRQNIHFSLSDINNIVFRRAAPSELTIVPRNEFYEDWTYEEHLLEVVSFVNRGGMLLVDVVSQDVREHPYDAALSIVKDDSGMPLDTAVRNLSKVSVESTLPTIRRELERFVEIVAVVLFRWEFNGNTGLDRRTLEIIELD
jgi:TIR domain-containing protein